MGRRAYWSSLLHLLLINFPYALLAWVYLFVFTLVSAFTRMTALTTHFGAAGHYPSRRSPAWCCAVLFRSPWSKGTCPR
jgi:hypothetical protein